MRNSLVRRCCHCSAMPRSPGAGVSCGLRRCAATRPINGILRYITAKIYDAGLPWSARRCLTTAWSSTWRTVPPRGTAARRRTCFIIAGRLESRHRRSAMPTVSAAFHCNLRNAVHRRRAGLRSAPRRRKWQRWPFTIWPARRSRSSALVRVVKANRRWRPTRSRQRSKRRGARPVTASSTSIPTPVIPKGSVRSSTPVSTVCGSV